MDRDEVVLEKEQVEYARDAIIQKVPRHVILFNHRQQHLPSQSFQPFSYHNSHAVPHSPAFMKHNGGLKGTHERIALGHHGIPL